MASGLLNRITYYFIRTDFDILQGFIQDCPNGKLDKKKFLELYKQFYPQGKADNFCK
jgi:hypothetical protein